MAHFQIQDLSFSYPTAKGKESLHHVNITIQKGEYVVLCGKSGSGKTTLVNLLLGKHNDYSGTIHYNDAELRDISIDQLFEISSFVEQNVFVFDDSIINNITMYSTIDEDLLNEAINKSGLASLMLSTSAV